MGISIRGKIENSILLYALIALSCMNFLGRGSIVFLVCALIGFFMINSSLRVDRSFAVIAITSLAMMVTALMHYGINEAIKVLNFMLLYLLFYNGFACATNKIKFIKRTIFSIFAGFAFFIVYTYVYNLNIDTPDWQRIIYSPWTGEEAAVTLVGLLSAVVIGYSFYAVFCQRKIWLKLLAIASLIIMFLVNIDTATRTPIILSIILFVVMYSINLISLKGHASIKSVVALMLLVCAIFVIYFTDAFGIRTMLLESPLFERFEEEGTETSRWEINKEHAEHMFEHLWGGGGVSEQTDTTPHNYIQEGHDRYGIIAFFGLILMTYYFIKNIVSLIKIKDKKPIDILFISMYLSMLIQMLLEPVFSGYPIIIMALIVIHALASGYLKNRQEALESEGL
ncbi:MAG: hypothetical protein IKB27_00890 [Clostridia bacterium]|nr:hypothetical protein [Clostridia bacterium]